MAGERGERWGREGERGGEVAIKVDFVYLCIRRKRIKWNVRNCDIFAC